MVWNRCLRVAPEPEDWWGPPQIENFEVPGGHRLALTRSSVNFDVRGDLADDRSMAKTVITQVTDDLDGSKDADTYSFAWDGTEYTIDLSKKNAKAFEKALEPYLESATKVGGRKKSSSATGSGRKDLAAVRAWAAENGYEVSARGRVSQEILNAYDAS